MATETIDIVVTKSGADEAAVAITNIGDSAQQATKGIDAATAAIGFMKDTTQATAPSIEQMAQAAGMSETMFRAASSAAARLNITVEEYNQRTQHFINGTNEMNAGLEETVKKTDDHAEATEKAAKGTEHLHEASKLLTEVLTALGLALTADKLIEMAEAYELMSIKMSSVSASASVLEEHMHTLFEISQQTGSSFEGNVKAFQKLAVETRGLGIEQDALLKVIEGVDTAVRLSGGSSQDASRAVDIFSRSLATGNVEGRIFRTVLRDFPELAQLVAKGLNEPISALIGFGAAAKTSSKDFVEGFNKASEEADKAGKTINLTLGGAVQTLKNALTQYVGQLNESSGSTHLMATAVSFLAENFNAIAVAVRVVATAFGSWYAISVIIPGAIGLIVTALNTLTAAALANPFTFMLAAVTTLIALVYQFGNSIKLTSDGSITLLGALVGAWNVLRNVLTNIWGMVGGPLTTAFSVFFTIVSAPLRLLVLIIQGVLTGLEALGRVAPGTAAAFDAMAAPVTRFKEIMTDAMKEATKKLNETGDSTKTLAQLLGGDDPRENLAGAATKASGAVGGLVVGLTQMGRVNAAAIPPFENLVMAADKATKAIENAKTSMDRYAKTIAEVAKLTADLSVTTRDAMGNIITYVNEAANQTASQYNKMSSSIDSVTASYANLAAAAHAASSASSSSSTSRSMDFGWGADVLGADGRPKPQTQGFQDTTGLTGWGAQFLQNTRRFASGGSFDVGGAGGTDSQLVQFMASPNERVTVETPEQRARAAAAQQPGQAGKSIVVNMTVQTPDADGFRRSRNQMLLDLRGRLNNV